MPMHRTSRPRTACQSTPRPHITPRDCTPTHRTLALHTPARCTPTHCTPAHYTPMYARIRIACPRTARPRNAQHAHAPHARALHANKKSVCMHAHVRLGTVRPRTARPLTARSRSARPRAAHCTPAYYTLMHARIHIACPRSAHHAHAPHSKVTQVTAHGPCTTPCSEPHSAPATAQRLAWSSAFKMQTRRPSAGYGAARCRPFCRTKKQHARAGSHRCNTKNQACYALGSSPRGSKPPRQTSGCGNQTKRWPET